MENLTLHDPGMNPHENTPSEDTKLNDGSTYVPPAIVRNDMNLSADPNSDYNRNNAMKYHPSGSQQNSFPGYRPRHQNASGPNQYHRNPSGAFQGNYPRNNQYNDYDGNAPQYPGSSHYDRNQSYRGSNSMGQSQGYGYGMNRQNYHNNNNNGNNSQWRDSYSSEPYYPNQPQRPAENNNWAPSDRSVPPQESGKPWQPNPSSNPQRSYYPNQNGYNNRNNWNSNSGGSDNYRSRAGQGHWDPQNGHVVAPRNGALEKTLFESAHVSTGINFNKYDDIPIEATGNKVPEMVTTFKDANLDPLLMENIELARYETPTPVQKYSLPIVEAGRDLMACAQTGSGKTAGFLFPILNELFIRGPPDELKRFHAAGARQEQPLCPMALILAPTRELTSQIYEEARRFSYRSWVRPVVVYGGVPMREQTMNLRQGCGLLVATPGRLTDLIARGMISLRHVCYLVLDEADRMLDMGFEPQIRGIVEGEDMPKSNARVTLMFSATFPRDIQYLARDFLSDYIFLSVGRVGAASEDVHQTVIEVSEDEKKDVLLDILHANPASAENLVLIFVETKKMCDMTAYFLKKNGFQAAAIHGDRDQREREYALDAFRNAERPILVATAVAARGLDIPNVTHVINYDLPNDIDDYVHRIGRTGRAGNPGNSMTFFNYEKNKNVVKDLVQILKDANQQVPSFLEGYFDQLMAPQRHHMANRGSGKSSRGRGAAHRDFRRDSEYSSYTPQPNRGNYYGNMNNNSNNNAPGNDWSGWDGHRW